MAILKAHKKQLKKTTRAYNKRTEKRRAEKRREERKIEEKLSSIQKVKTLLTFCKVLEKDMREEKEKKLSNENMNSKRQEIRLKYNITTFMKTFFSNILSHIILKPKNKKHKRK